MSDTPDARRGIVAIVVGFISVLSSHVAIAQDVPPSASVRVIVEEQLSRRPVALAHVRLETDARERDGYTNDAGSVTFDVVPAGSYGIYANADGYAVESGVANVHAGAALTITLLATRTRPPKIGAVASRSPAQPPAATIRGRSDAPSEIAGSTGAALSTLPAIDVTPDGSLAIHGHGPSTTTATVDGAPIFSPGAKLQLSLLGSDIFQSGGLDPNSVAGAPDGALSLQTYDPTLDWQGIVQERAASYGGTATTEQIRGTAGRLGLSLVDSATIGGNTLEGQTYADTSGLTYQHDLAERDRGDILTARYGFDPNHVAFVDVGRLSSNAPLDCDERFGPLPCGYGPGNVTLHSVSFEQLRDTLTLDRESLELHVFHSHDDLRSDFSGHTTAGSPDGYVNETSTDRTGLLAKLGILYGRSSVANVSFSTVRDRSLLSGSFVSPAEPIPPEESALSSLQIDVPLLEKARAKLRGSAGRDVAQGIARLNTGLTASYLADDRDVVTGTYRAGHLASPQYSFVGVSSPGDLAYDCAGDRALGGGPTISGSSAAPTYQTRLEVKHTGAQLDVDLDAYRDVDVDAPVTAIVPAAALPSTLLGSSYFAQAGAFGAAECLAPFSAEPGRTYFGVTAPVSKDVVDGVDGSAEIDLGTRTHVTAAYTIARARAFGVRGLLSRAADLAPGAQVPNVPLHRGQLTVRFAESRATTLLAALTYTGANNWLSPRPVTTLDLGVRLRAERGDVVVALQNATNVLAGPYATFAPFPEIQRPVGPRTISVRYRLPLGREDVDRTPFLSGALPANTRFFFVPTPFGFGGTSLLKPTTDRPFCGAESVADASRYLDAIGEYADALQSARVAGTPLASVRPPVLSGMRMETEPNAPGTIRIDLDLSQRRTLAAFMRCAPIHVGTYDEARRLGLYAPGWREREADGASTLFYEPRVGLYMPPEAVNETEPRTERARQLPSKAPADPFAIDRMRCPANDIDAAAEAAARLRAYVAAYYAKQRPAAPNGVIVVSHTAKSDTWLEIRFDERPFNAALAECLDAPLVTPSAVAARGLGGAIEPSINYAPAVGFYQVRPATRMP